MTKFAVIPINAVPEGGAIQFIDCVLQNCWFVDAKIIGDEEEIAHCEVILVVGKDRVIIL